MQVCGDNVIVKDIRSDKVNPRFKYKRYLDNEDNILGAYRNELLIGILSYDTDHEGSLLIMFIEVLYEYRGMGICKELINHIMDRLQPDMVKLIPETYESRLVFLKLIDKGILPKNTSLEG